MFSSNRGDTAMLLFISSSLLLLSVSAPATGAAISACPRIVSRSEWGARDPKRPRQNLTISPVPYVVVHHGGLPEYCLDQEACAAIVRSYQDLHMDTNGWDDIGYSFLVGEDGNVYEGRGWDSVGAHAPGYNQQSVGICVIGDFTGRLPNAAALLTMLRLTRCGVPMGKVLPTYSVLGHRQVRDTQCPGDALYPWVQSLPRWTDSPQPCVDGVCPDPSAAAWLRLEYASRLRGWV